MQKLGTVNVETTGFLFILGLASVRTYEISLQQKFSYFPSTVQGFPWWGGGIPSHKPKNPKIGPPPIKDPDHDRPKPDQSPTNVGAGLSRAWSGLVGIMGKVGLSRAQSGLVVLSRAQSGSVGLGRAWSG